MFLKIKQFDEILKFLFMLLNQSGKKLARNSHQNNQFLRELSINFVNVIFGDKKKNQS